MAASKIEQYLIDLKYNYKEVKPNFWLLDDEKHGLGGLAVIHADPIVIVRVQLMDTPILNREHFFAKLLELNATDMIRGAYGLEGEKVVITDTLVYETLDYAEFRASLDAISLALAQHFPILSVYRDTHGVFNDERRG